MKPTSASPEAGMSRSRKSSVVSERRPSLNMGQPTSFFLAREEDVFAAAAANATEEVDTTPDSTYGVQSLEEAIGQALGGEELLGKRKRKGYGHLNVDKVDEGSLSRHSTPEKTRGSRANTISQPLTPLHLESPFPESGIPGTPKSGSFRSLRLSDEDDAASQAITSGGEEEEGQGAPGFGLGVAPELVMPSLSMPSRRPFTELGKRMGRLKVAVAGASGVGKTSLIRAIVRQCEDIVHLDPFTAQLPYLQTSTVPFRRRSSGKISASPNIIEIQASTKAYPTWWSDMEETRVLRRRKSMGETVLERNLCFIDSNGPTDVLIRYLEGLFQKNASLECLGESEILGVLSGNGGVQVDVVLFVCEDGDGLSESDKDYMRKLSKFASVVPVLAKMDLVTYAELLKKRDGMRDELLNCGVNPSLLSKAKLESPFGGGEPTPMLDSQSTIQAPFLVSSLPGTDHGEMDASLLMSPSYSPPLVPSELEILVDVLFNPENIAKLRHISSRKFLQWRERQSEVGGLELALARSSPQRRVSSPGTGGILVRAQQARKPSPFDLDISPAASIGVGLSDFSRARVRDHIQREERLAQVQLAKWASDLQKGIRREREEYGALVEGERARWLLERVGEEAAMGRIGPVSGWSGALEKKRRRRGTSELPPWARSAGMGNGHMREFVDPLGLCGLGDGIKRGADVLLKALGGGVLVGAVWMAICRAWGWEERWWLW